MTDNSPPVPSGVHMARGVSLRIPDGGLRITVNEQGELSAKLNVVHLQLKTCADWLGIAMEHLGVAHRNHHELISAHQSAQDISALLHAEFRSAMQAAVASATFFEALYAATLDCLPQSRSAPRAEGRRQAARAAHVTEQLKRAFGLGQQGMRNLASVLSEIYRFRDEAVHPAAGFGIPSLHPVLGLAVERRFAMYTYGNARELVRGALANCEILPIVAQRQGPKEIQALSRYLLESGEPLFRAWRSSYGALRDDEDSPIISHLSRFNDPNAL